MEKQNPNDKENNLDSPINTAHANARNDQSLTNDEDASTDPNDVKTKPSFKENETRAERDNSQESGRFDGNIGI